MASTYRRASPLAWLERMVQRQALGDFRRAKICSAIQCHVDLSRSQTTCYCHQEHDARKGNQSCRQIPSGSIESSVRHLRKYTGRSWMQTPWSNGFLPTDTRARCTIWTPQSAVLTRCRSRILPQATATPSAANTLNWCRTNVSATRTSSTSNSVGRNADDNNLAASILRDRGAHYARRLARNYSC